MNYNIINNILVFTFKCLQYTWKTHWKTFNITANSLHFNGRFSAEAGSEVPLMLIPPTTSTAGKFIVCGRQQAD